MANKKQYVSNNPDLLAEWDHQKNSEIGLYPDSVTLGSKKRAWWKCEKSHSWSASIYKRTTGQGCPFCSNKKVLPGYNDLVTTNPGLLNEWDYDKNTEISPTSITSGSNKKVWWLCSKGHSWQASVCSRNKGSGCPYCSGRFAITGINDLNTLYPKITKEWNYSKNTGMNPSATSAYSNKKVWWICSKGHEWKASVVSRTQNGRNCPYCANQKALKGYNDLQSLYPELANEWNYLRNNGITPDQIVAHTNKKYWWKCKKGHEWEATVSSRIRGNGCRLCSRELATSFPEQAIFYYMKQVYYDAINGYSDNTITEIDVYIPSKRFGIEYDGQYFHTDLSRDARKDLAVSAKGIILYRVKESASIDYGNSVYVEKNNTIYYDPRNKDRLNAVIIRLFDILSVNNYPDIDIDRDRTIIWSQYIQRAKENNLQNHCPSLALEWNYEKNGSLTPDLVTYKSGKKVWWKCNKCGTEWEAIISHRVNGTGCPNCASKKISMRVSKLVTGQNDLLTMNPDIAEEWNYERNGDLEPINVYYKSNKVVWWKCKYCGYEYKAPIVQRTKLKTLCRKCTYAIKKGCLADKYPELLNEWDYNKNNQLNPKLVTPGSGKKAWWKCHVCGYEWQARISHRVSGSGCPNCSLKGFTKSNAKKVYQYDLNGKLVNIFHSIAEAKKETGVTGIYDCCSHRLKTSGGFIWRYADEVEEINEKK